MAEGRPPLDLWAVGSAYHAFMGRWSGLVARELVRWLGVPPRGRWLDVGCGAGALSGAILEEGSPAAVLGVDRSEAFVAHARERCGDPRASFQVGDAMALPVPDGGFDAVVSGLVLNFVPDRARMVAEMARAARPGGVVGVYVWDYAEGMELLLRFWEAARALDPAAGALAEAARFRDCAPAPLEALLRGPGLSEVRSRAVDVPMAFRDFEDCWSPFLGGQGPGPAYAMSLPEDRRGALRERLRATLPTGPDRSISLRARALAVRGIR